MWTFLTFEHVEAAQTAEAAVFFAFVQGEVIAVADAGKYSHLGIPGQAVSCVHALCLENYLLNNRVGNGL